jgi:predicted nucleic acid-binding protein
LLYVDTSVLLVYTLTQALEKDRYRATAGFFAKITTASLSGATSFYALHELYVFAISNAPDFPTGAAYGKNALAKVLSLPLPLQILPFVSRTERRLHARRFTALHDASDVPHAIAAAVYRCEAIVAYDQHFKAISHLIPHKTPEDFL